VPGPIHLLPKELSRPKHSGPEEIVPAPNDALPEFSTPAHFLPDKNSRWVHIVSVSAHAAVIALLLTPFFSNFSPPLPPKDKRTITELAGPPARRLDPVKLPGRGGGGGGERSTIPVTTGHPPRFKMEDQLATPTVIKNPTPELSAEMTLVGLSEKMQSDPLPIGDPLAAIVTNSNGPGAAAGMGTGAHGGVGPGDGPGKGLGRDGGEGGDVFRPGTIGVGWPACFYSPQPPYTDEARQAKYSGTVLVDAIVTADGRVNPTRVLKNPGLGLDDSVIKTLKTWRCKPAQGPDHRPVAVAVPFEVAFRLF
jgi:periplasmic protein TonB